MDITFYFKAISIVFAAFTAILAYLKFTDSSRSSLREQYKFAKEVMKDLKEEQDIHPFLKEKGLQAIAGSKDIAAEEIDYILSLRSPSSRLTEFMKAQKLLTLFGNEGYRKFCFKGRYNKKTYRFVLKIFYGCIYFLSVFAAFYPIVFANSLNIEPFKLALTILIVFIIFVFYAIVAANAFLKITLAENLVSKQCLQNSK